MALSGEGLCITHDPARAEAHRTMSRNGGTRSAESKKLAKLAHPDDIPPEPKTLVDAVRMASWLSRAPGIGKIGVREAREMTGALRVFLEAIAKQDLQRELAQARKQLEELRKGAK